MVRLTPAGIFPFVVLGCLIAAATPVYALIFGLAWAWRLWVATVSHVMSFALYQRLYLQVRR